MLLAVVVLRVLPCQAKVAYFGLKPAVEHHVPFFNFFKGVFLFFLFSKIKPGGQVPVHDALLLQGLHPAGDLKYNFKKGNKCNSFSHIFSSSSFKNSRFRIWTGAAGK